MNLPLDLGLEASLAEARQETRVFWQHALERLTGAYAPSTLRGYRRTFTAFESWCLSEHVEFLPAEPETVARYLEYRSDALKPPSLGHVATCIGRIHRLAGHRDPTLDIDVFLALRRAKRKCPHRPRQALGLTSEKLQAMAGGCENDPAGLRDKTLMLVGFESLCRGSEIATLRVEDLARTAAGTFTLLIRKGKADQTGRGRIVVLSARTAQVIEQWLIRSGLSAGILLPKFDKAGSALGPLSTVAITRILLNRARCAGLAEAQVLQISSHSLRVGGAQQLTMNRRNLAQIMRAGGWRSVGTVSRYIEGAELSIWEDQPIGTVAPVLPAKHRSVRGWK